jgi:flagellar biosynthesis activator protein FlaF
MYSSPQTSEAVAENLAPPPVNDQRHAEFQAFDQVTRELAANKSKTKEDPEFLRALDDNRRLWHALEEDLARPQNQLPDPLKAQIISVAIWVERHSKLAEQGEATTEALIQVNESIMKGLAA